MKHIFRKNQMIVTALALMIAAAGYLNYNNGVLDDTAIKTQAKSDAKTDYETTDETISQADILTDTEESGEVGDEQEDTGGTDAGETVLTGSDKAAIDLATELKLNREQTRAANKEALTEIINNETLSEKEKQPAVEQMAILTDISEREAACELMLETKGYEGAIVSITENEADVVVNVVDITDANRAQIEDVIERKGKIDPQHIVISNMAER